MWRRGQALRVFLPVVTVLTQLFPGAPRAEVVINEVLYDPAGADAGREFVEIMNCGREGVLLSGWVLETGNGANPDDWTGEWIGGDFDYLEPGGILVVGEDEVMPPPDVVTSLDLQNGPDGVRLTDGTAVVDVVGWGEPLFGEYYEGAPAEDVSSGTSLARIPDCYDLDDNSHDFMPCKVPTPGARNAPEHDLALCLHRPGQMIFDPEEAVSLSCVVRNVGSFSTEGYAPVLKLFIDGGDDPVSSASLERVIAPRDSLKVEATWRDARRGYHLALVEICFEPDTNPGNDAQVTTFAVGSPGGLVAVNEIMHSPAEGGTEWVELVNVSQETLSLASWGLGDDEERHPFRRPERADSTCVVAPGGFVVVAKAAELLGDTGGSPVVETDGWEALSADDTVVLTDRFQTPIDVVVYEKQWGGGKAVSLERVRPDMPSDDRNNWGGCVGAQGSTPGRENSIFTEALPSGGKISVAPNPFTPDGDGENDRAVIGFDLPVARATARLSVFDLKGRRRATLMDHVDVAGRGEFLWDGTGADGALLPTGLYVLYLEAINAPLGVLVTAKAGVAIVR